jgi:hypothetical protein
MVVIFLHLPTYLQMKIANYLYHYFLFLYPTYVTDSDEPKGKEKRQKGGSGKGFLAPLQLSDALSKFLGESELSRSDVIKRMWDYIKGNNLQVC